MANLVEGGDTPLLSHQALQDIGFSIAAYPLTLLSSAMRAMQSALESMQQGRHPESLLSFEELRRIVGFDDYYRMENRYR